MPYRPAISSHSLGRAWVHNLPEKFDEAARFGLDIELFHEDLTYVAAALPGGVTLRENHLAAAHIIRSLCDARGLTIVCLQPFLHYEGLRDRMQHGIRIQELYLFIDVAHILGTDLIGVPSTFMSEEDMSGDLDLIVADLQELADIGALADIRFAHESLCWGTHADTWEQSWEIVSRVDRPNFGICLDTFNIAGRVFADPATTDGRTPNADAALQDSLERLVRTVDGAKVMFVQVVDAEQLREPLVEGHPFYDPQQRPRMSWSRNCRLFYGEEERGAYLPVAAILEAIFVGLGYEGYVSAELFNRSLMEKDPSVPRDHASRAAVSWRRIVCDFGLDTGDVSRSSFVAAKMPLLGPSIERAQL